MSKATTVLQPGVAVTLAPAGNVSFEIETGQRFRLTQPEGEQVADLISFNRDDRRELLSMHSSRPRRRRSTATAPARCGRSRKTSPARIIAAGAIAAST